MKKMLRYRFKAFVNVTSSTTDSNLDTSVANFRGVVVLDIMSPHETGLAGTKLQRVNHLIDPFNPHTTPVVPQRRLH